jgi:hypothetical protein
MVWNPNDETQNRVLYALRLMQSKGIGIERAAKEAKTTRRSVRRYGEHLGVKFKGKEGQALQFVGQPIHKIEDFLIKMHGGTSATKAARELKTTVRSMSRQQYKGQLSLNLMVGGYHNLSLKRKSLWTFTDTSKIRKGMHLEEIM